MKVSPFFVGNFDMNRRKADEQLPVYYGIDNIEVEMLWMTPLESEEWKRTMAHMVKATEGKEPTNEELEMLNEDILKGGLQHALENIIVIFKVKNCSRAFTHQVVRHRKMRFHQHGLRWSVPLGFRFNSVNEIDEETKKEIEEHWNKTIKLFNKLIDKGFPNEDARSILPIGTATYIIVETDLKAFADAFSYRGCAMFMPETQHIFWRMRDLIVEKYPFLENMLRLACEKQQVCTYQGMEDVDKQCNAPWKVKRIYKSYVNEVKENEEK